MITHFVLWFFFFYHISTWISLVSLISNNISVLFSGYSVSDSEKWNNCKRQGRYFHIVFRLLFSFILEPFCPSPFLSFLFLPFSNCHLLIQYDKEVLKETNTSDNEIAECIFIIPQVKMADWKLSTLTVFMQIYSAKYK